ncbi:unnamed protein product [Schistosoma turkestanicum]|nr:unnamed protein product [Schistosoma turkestanicum]
MPRCRKEKKLPYRNDDGFQNMKSSVFRDGERNLRNYADPVDDRMKDAYDRTKSSDIYKDLSNNARSYPKWNDYDRSRPINSYRIEDSAFSRNIRDGYEPPYTAPQTNNLMGDLPVSRNIRDGYEPRHLSPYQNRSNNLMGDLPGTRNIQDAYEPHYIPVKSNRPNHYVNNMSEPRNIQNEFEPRRYTNSFMGDLPTPSSVSNNGNTYSYSIPQRPNLKIVREENNFNRYVTVVCQFSLTLQTFRI